MPHNGVEDKSGNPFIYVGSSFDNSHAVMLLFVVFAILAVFLSERGIYGVLAYDVSQRTDGSGRVCGGIVRTDRRHSPRELSAAPRATTAI